MPSRYTYVPITSAVSNTCALYISRIFCVSLFKMPCIFKIINTTTVGKMEGSVTFHACCQRLAPSITAASYSSGATPESAAR